MLRESPSLARLVYPVCGAVGETTDVVVTLLVDVVPVNMPLPVDGVVATLDEFIVTT